MSFKTYGLHCKTVSRHHHLFVNTCHGYFSFTKQTWYHNIFISLLGCDIFSHCIWFENWLISCGTEVILEEKLLRQIQIRSNTRPKVDIFIGSITSIWYFSVLSSPLNFSLEFCQWIYVSFGHVILFAHDARGEGVANLKRLNNLIQVHPKQQFHFAIQKEIPQINLSYDRKWASQLISYWYLFRYLNDFFLTKPSDLTWSKVFLWKMLLK